MATSLGAGMMLMAGFKWVAVWMLVIALMWISNPSLLFGGDEP